VLAGLALAALHERRLTEKIAIIMADTAETT
jgi:hypothetical protein